MILIVAPKEGSVISRKLRMVWSLGGESNS
jgi:hypothetical protein